MSIASIIVTFASSWWIIFYTLLPIGNKTTKIQVGNADSAPDNPRMTIKLLSTTLLAALITFGFLHLVEIKVIDFEGYFTGYNKRLLNL